MADGARDRLVGYPVALAGVVLFPLRVLRFFAGALWRGGLFPILPGRIYDHGKVVGRLGDGAEVAGKVLAVAVLGALEAARLLRRPFDGWIGVIFVFGLLWAVLGLTGQFHGILAAILGQIGLYVVGVIGGIYMLLLPIGIYRVRKYAGLRREFFRKLES